MVVVTVNPLIEEEGEETLITEVVEVVEALIAKLLLAHHNSILSISFNNFLLVLVEQNQRDQYVRYVEKPHTAIDCYHRMDYAYQGKHPPIKLAAMATASNACITKELPWLADSAATNHVNASLDHLSFLKP